MLITCLNRSLKCRFLLRLIPLLLLLGALGYQAFLYVVSDVSRVFSQHLAEKQVLYDRERIMAPILRDLSLARHLAGSQVLVQWAMNENDSHLQQDGLKLLESYRFAFDDGSYFFVIDKSGNYYFNDKQNAYAGRQRRYALSPDSAKDAWYYDTKKDGRLCQINVNNDPELKTAKVWVNCLVRDGGHVVGIVGSGRNLTEFIKTVVNAHEPGISNFAINQDGAIQVAPDLSQIDYASLTHQAVSSKNIYGLFEQDAERKRFSALLRRMKGDSTGAATTFTTLNGRPMLIGIASMRAIGWFNVTVIDLEKLGLAKYFMPFMFWAGLAMVIVLMLMGLLLNRMILSRIHKLDQNVQLMSAGDASFSTYSGAPDELGRLNERFIEMATRVREYSQGLEQLVDQRTGELKKATLKAQSRGQQLHAIIEHAMDGIMHIDAKGVICSFNPEAEKIFAYGAKEVIGQNISMLMPEPHRSRHDAYIKAYLETGQPPIIGTEREITARRKDGRTFILSLVVNTMTIKGELSFVVIARDITRRRQAEESVRKLTSAIEQASECIIITDRQGVIEYANPAFTTVTGYSPEGAIGQTLGLLNSGNQDSLFYKNMWAAITDGQAWQGKVINRKKDGHFYPAMLMISPILDDSGEITHFVSIQSDLSRLEDMEQRFHEAQKLEAIGTMAGGIAHNFNNMLAGMTGNLYLAKKKAQAMPDVVRKLSNVEALSRHAAGMIQQLLAFACKGMVCMKTMQLAPFVRETLKLLCASVPEHITVQQDICSDNMQITGDATQLHQVLANLLGNACDAVEGVHDPRIVVRLDAFYPDDALLARHADFNACAYAHLSVRDNGCGIPEHQMKNLFEPFFTTKEPGQHGVGLGLSVAYGAIKTHHGVVEVNSRAGGGSTFHVYIPLLEQKAVPAEPALQAASGQGEVILLADDEPVVRDVTAEILESMGYQVLQAGDGLAAMEQFKAHEPDIALALLDMVMPHGGGMALIKRIRALRPDVPVIFLTDYDTGQILQGDDAVPNSDVLTKPLLFDELSHCIRQMLD